LKIFLSSTAFIPALGPTQSIIQCVPSHSFPEGKVAGAWSWPYTSI